MLSHSDLCRQLEAMALELADFFGDRGGGSGLQLGETGAVVFQRPDLARSHAEPFRVSEYVGTEKLSNRLAVLLVVLQSALPYDPPFVPVVHAGHGPEVVW